MNLSKQMISLISSKEVQIPPVSCFDLPEKVLQFGTGVLLKALPDYFIDQANKRGLFNGRIVLVKSTNKGETGSYERQDNLFTLCIKGQVDGKKHEENILNASISRLLHAKTQWKEILACAANPDLQVIISNTTEIGIQFMAEDIKACPPESFPGKLLAFLYQRYLIFQGSLDHGLVIIPTELLPGNGEKLRDILSRLSEHNRLGKDFQDWLLIANDCCNSLVDRIVPGKLPADQQEEMEQTLGYRDELMIMAEPYRLWAIESDKERVRDILSFHQADPGVIIAADITMYRELKLRLLNGSHSFCCGLAHLAGFETVKNAMKHPDFFYYIQSLMFTEIIPAITNAQLSYQTALAFARQVLDRFGNPFIEHLWLSITLQYASKMKMRNVPLLINYSERYGSVPENMTLGFAAHLLFMKSARAQDGQYYGEANGKPYLVNDELAPYYAGQWEEPASLVNQIMSNKELWGTDLTKLPGFLSAVTEKLQRLMQEGAASVLQQILVSKENSNEEEHIKNTSRR
jgi:tagaturonate reductase